MNAPLTPYQIADLWSEAVAADRVLNHWAESNYGRAFAVSIGADMRRPPEEEDAPFIAIFPDSGKTGPQRQANTSEIGIVAGLADAEFLEENDVSKMRGLKRLNELVPLLEKALRFALPKARLQEVGTEYEIMQFPLCQALMSITVKESLPVGRRL